MNRFKMDESIPSRSFISLSNSDSGLTLLKADSLVRKVAEQEEELKRKDERINDLEEQVIDLQDIIEKYKRQISDIRRKQAIPKTTWVSDLVAQNEIIKEESKKKSNENKELVRRCHELEISLQDKSDSLESYEMKFEKWQIDKKNLLIKLEEQQEIWMNVALQLEEAGKNGDAEINQSSNVDDLFDKFDVLQYSLASLQTTQDATDQKKTEVSQISIDVLTSRLQVLAGTVSKQVTKLIKEKRELNSQNKELLELAEFMNFENKFTLEENAELTKSKERCQEENNILLVKQKELKKICSGYATFAGKMFRKRNVALNKLNEVNKSKEKLLELAVAGKRKRKTLNKKYRESQQQLALNRKRLVMERKIIRRLGARNLELDLQIACLNGDIKECQLHTSCMEETMKSAFLDNLALSEQIEEQKIMQSQIDVLKETVLKRDKALSTANQEKDKMKSLLIAERNIRAIIEIRLKLSAADRQQLQSVLEQELSAKQKLEDEIIRLKSTLEDLQRPSLNCFQRLFRRRNH